MAYPRNSRVWAKPQTDAACVPISSGKARFLLGRRDVPVGADMEWAQTVFRMKPWWVALAMLAMVAAVAAQAQNPSREDVVRNLRSNVVRIIVHPGAGALAREGFGFVVGEDEGQLYIVTADHVVRGDGPDDIDKKPTVIFFQDQGKEYAGELLGTHLPRRQGDLAVLRIPSPPKFAWNRKAQAPAPCNAVPTCGLLAGSAHGTCQLDQARSTRSSLAVLSW